MALLSIKAIVNQLILLLCDFWGTEVFRVGGREDVGLFKKVWIWKILDWTLMGEADG
jgi:hypothetical protein